MHKAVQVALNFPPSRSEIDGSPSKAIAAPEPRSQKSTEKSPWLLRPRSKAQRITASFVWTPELNVVESSTAVISGEARGLSFPLEIGKKWDYKYSFANKLNPTKGRWQLEANVAAYEKVKVPAGEFDAFKIEYKGFWNNDTSRQNGRLMLTNWFAPATRSVVKTEFDDGYNKWVRQLVEFQLQP